MASSPQVSFSPEMETHRLVVLNIPGHCACDTLENYLESRMDKDVKEIKQEPGAEGVALVTFVQPVDVFESRLQLSEKPLRNHTLEVDSVAVPKGVVLWDVPAFIKREDIARSVHKFGPGEITPYPNLGVWVVHLGNASDVKDAPALLKNCSKRVEPYYDTFHQEVFNLLLASPNLSSSPEKQELCNLVIRDIANEKDSDSDSSQSSDQDSPKASSNSGGPQKSEKSFTAVQELEKPKGSPRGKQQQQQGPPVPQKEPASKSRHRGQVTPTKEGGQAEQRQKPSPRPAWAAQATPSPKMASSPKSSDPAPPSAKEQSETLNIGVAQLGLLDDSHFFDSMTKCNVSLNKGTGSVTLSGPPGVTVAAKMELQFKAGSIVTETLSVSPEAAIALATSSNPAWAKPGQVSVHISDSGKVTCAAFTEEEKSRAVNALKNFISPQNSPSNPSASGASQGENVRRPVVERRGPDLAWGENKVAEVALGRSAGTAATAGSPVRDEKVLSEKGWYDDDDDDDDVPTGSDSDTTVESASRMQGDRNSSRQHSPAPSSSGRGRESPEEELSNNKENRPRNYGRGRGRGKQHRQQKARNRDFRDPGREERNKEKHRESPPRSREESSGDKSAQGGVEHQGPREKESSSEPPKTEHFHLIGAQARCFLKNCNIKDVEAKFREASGQWGMTPGGDDEELTITLTGPQAAVTTAHRQLRDKAKRLWHERVLLEKDVARSKPVQLALLAQGLRNGDILDLCGGLERKNKCFISFHLPPPQADKSLVRVARSAPPAPEKREAVRGESTSPPSPHRGHHHGNQGSRPTHHRRLSGSNGNQGQLQHRPRSGSSQSPWNARAFSLDEMMHGPTMFARESTDDFSARPISKTLRVKSTNITLKQGDIAKEKANILVCFIGADRKLENSAVGQAFLKVGGQEFKKNFEAAAAGSEESPVICCGGGDLQCGYVFTLVLKKFSRSSDKFLEKCVRDILEMAPGLDAASIALPALGTGQRLAFPASVVASASVTVAASLANSRSGLKSVTFVVYDPDCCREFQQVLTSVEDGSLPIPSMARTPSPPRSRPSPQASPPDRKPQTLSLPAPSPSGKPSGKPSAAGTGDTGVSSWSEAYVRVYAASKEDCQADTAAITARLKEDFLSKALIERRLIGTLRQDARRQIVQAAAKEGVWVKFPEDRRRKHEIPKLTLQGESKAVLKAQNEIQKLLEQEKSSFGAGPSADDVPRSGTPEFLKYMGRMTNHEPPTYWKCYRPGFSLAALIMDMKDVAQKYHKEKLEDEEYKEVEAVVMKTWRRDLVGHGKDAAGLRHQSIAVKKIRRLENRELYRTYAEYRAKLFTKAAHLGKPFARVESLPQCKGPVQTTANTRRSLKRDIYPEVNEHYLLHGTKADTVKGICAHGIQSRLASDKNMFGAGAYLCESSTKADQYADPKDQRSGGEKTMVLLRALLGQPFVTATATTYKIPPCRRQCGEQKCDHDRFDSVIADGRWNFREFVLYHEAQMYPEYIITYERV